jgi:hypothetical protein
MVLAGMGQVQEPADHRKREDADRQVDVKHPAPAVHAEQVVLAGEQAADHRAGNGGQSEDCHEVAQVLRPFARGDDVTDDGECQRHQAAGADALNGTEASQFQHRG